MAKTKHSSTPQRAGNATKLSQSEELTPQYATSTVTNYRKKGQDPPQIDSDDVNYAKNFVQENKK